ncbi:nucleotidyltransferase domain-containing protein [Bdellovibrionota bacterium FG-1]
MKIGSRGRPLIGIRRKARICLSVDPLVISELKARAVAEKASVSELAYRLIKQGLQPRQKIQISIPSKSVAEFCQSHGIKTLGVFGSALTERFNQESDVDLLVEFKEGKVPGFFQIVQMEEELATIFGGRKIDLRTFFDLSQYFRERVKSEAEAIYAA